MVCAHMKILSFMDSPFNPLGAGDLKFLLLNQSFICHGSQFSSLFTILQELMSP